MNYEITSITNEFSYSVRYYMNEIITLENGEKLERIAFENYEVYQLQIGDNVNNMGKKIIQRAQELKIKFDLLREAQMAIRGTV